MLFSSIVNDVEWVEAEVEALTLLESQVLTIIINLPVPSLNSCAVESAFDAFIEVANSIIISPLKSTGIILLSIITTGLL